MDLTKLQKDIEQVSWFIEPLSGELRKRIIGQEELIENVLIALLSGGHILLEGVPGLAKTLLCRSLAETLNVEFSRIQFTPDLLPADVIGTMIYNEQLRKFEVHKGPVFAQIVLADEINRAPAKVQSALLEAMQERQVTIGSETHKLDKEFLVLATQNPIDQEGTYPLPEAQVDRFMMQLNVDYPSVNDEILIVDTYLSNEKLPAINQISDLETIAKAKAMLPALYMEDKVKKYIVQIVDASRNPEKYGLSELKNYIDYGASPRASIFLNIGARAYAMINHRAFITPDDVKAVAANVLRHRLVPSFEAEAENVSRDQLVQMILDKLDTP